MGLQKDFRQILFVSQIFPNLSLIAEQVLKDDDIEIDERLKQRAVAIKKEVLELIKEIIEREINLNDSGSAIPDLDP